MSGATEILKITEALLAVIQVAEALGVNIKEFNDLVQKSRDEGREITNLELEDLANKAQAAVDRL